MYLRTYLPLKVTRYLNISRHHMYFHHSSSVAAYLACRNLIVYFSSGISLKHNLQSHGEMGLTWKSNMGENSVSR